jgi:hypothetical protein
MYSFLNIFFFVFHSCLILFILLGWIWRKTRRANFIMILLTAFSWFVLGLWYGFGYCPCTDWHWKVRLNLGIYDMPDSYSKFLIDTLTGWNTPIRLVDTVTVSLLLAAFGLSLFVNIRDWKNRPEKGPNKMTKA